MGTPVSTNVQPGAGRIIFRWQGVPCNDDGNGCTDGGPVNFEIELRSDGTIKTRYGSGNTDLLPVVGISGGSPDAYVIDSHTSEDVLKSLTNAQEVTFLPRSATPTPTPTPVATPTPSTYFVSGRIVDANNNPVSSVRILFERNFEGTTSTSTTFTDAAGNFSSGDLGCQNNVKVTPSRSGFTFNPLSLAFVSSRCLTDTATANFTASGSGPATNPLEDRDYFVNQHYRDFLDRDADAGGLGYWSDQLATCGSDADCIKKRRVGVSAAFFVEAEFQRTGSFVYRLYKGDWRGDRLSRSSRRTAPRLWRDQPWKLTSKHWHLLLCSERSLCRSMRDRRQTRRLWTP